MKRRTPHRAVLLAAATAVAIATSPPADAVIIRHDRLVNTHNSLGDAAHPVGVVTYLFGLAFGSGTLISPRWVLTAGHVVDDETARTFHVGGNSFQSVSSYPAAAHIPHPNWNATQILGGFDIGLVKLQSTTGVQPASRFTGSDEVGRLGVSFGFGLFGEGDDPARTLDGRRRGGYNMIDALGVAAYGPTANNDILAADFDDPHDADGRNSFGGSTTPHDFEIAVASGDSGGPMFVELPAGEAFRRYIAGVHSFVEAPDPPNGDNVDDSGYSDTYGSTRVSAFNAWIDDQIANHWINAAGGTFGAAGNWTPGVPDQYDVVGFTIPGTYTVTFAGNIVNDRIIARAGEVTLDLAGNAYTLQSQTFEGSLIVGRYAGNEAGLLVTNGVLTTRETVIAEQPGSIGALGIGAAGTWNAVGDVYVGGNFIHSGGTGFLVLFTGSNATVTGNAKLFGGGTLQFSGGTFGAAGIEVAGGTVSATAAANVSTPINVTTGGTFSADAALNLTGPLTTAAGVTVNKTGAGALTISGPQTHGAGSVLTASTGTLNLNSNAGGNLTVNANAATNFNVPQNLKALNIGNGATATLAAGGGNTLKTGSVSASGTGKLDVKDNAVVIDYTGATVEPETFDLLADGYNAGGWNGPGIMSSSAGGGGLYALGYGESADLLDMTAGETEMWRGQMVDATSILIRFTYAGDATLDGFISGDDYSAIDFASGTPGADGWSNGDFNYDGLISGDDYSIIDFNLVAQGPPLGAGSIGGVTPVPEPAGVTLFAVASLAAAARRRRRVASIN